MLYKFSLMLFLSIVQINTHSVHNHYHSNSSVSQQLRQLETKEHQKQSFDMTAFLNILIVLIYLGGLILVVHEKAYNQTLEDMVSLIQLNYYSQDQGLQIFNISPTLVYPMLHGFSYTVLFLCCIYDKKTDLGLSTVISSDQFNLLVVYQMIVCRTSQQIDRWLFCRDNIYYCIGLIMIIIFQFAQWFDLATGFIMVVYFLVYKQVLAKNNTLKQKILRWTGRISKDQDFSSQKHFGLKMRRYSITELMNNNCIKSEEPQRDFRVSLFATRMKTQAVIHSNNIQLYSDFYKAVMKVIYGIRQHIKNMKNGKYKALEQTIILNKKEQSDYQNSQQDLEDDIMVNRNNGCNYKTYQITTNQNELLKSQQEEIDDVFENDDQMLTVNQLKEINTQHYSSIFVIDFPKNGSFFDKLLWIIYSPFIILLELVPSYRNNISYKYLYLNFLISLIAIFSIVVIMHAIIMKETRRLKVEVEIWGNNLLGIVFSIPFMKYNMKVAQVNKQSDFLQCFMLLSIYKMGVLVGLSWMILN